MHLLIPVISQPLLIRAGLTREIMCRVWEHLRPIPMLQEPSLKDLLTFHPDREFPRVFQVSFSKPEILSPLTHPSRIL